MQVLAFISELNPFHAGHKYLIEQIKEAYPDSYIVTVMSGDYVCRGEVAIFDKWSRAKIAVENGVDLVFELPAIFSLSNAEDFARHSIRLLKSLAIVDGLFFGCENPNIEYLQKAKDIIISRKKEVLSSNAKELLFPKNSNLNLDIRELINKTLGSYPESNDILAMEYLRFLPSDIDIIPIKRVHAKYNSNKDTNYSASSIRKKIKTSNNLKYNANDNYYSALRFDVLKKSFENIFDKSDTIRIKKSAYENTDYALFLRQASHKRLTKNRIRREIMRSFLEIDKSVTLKYKDTNYLRVLALNEKGLAIIKKIQSPIILNYADVKKVPASISELFNLNESHSEIYHACYDQIPFTDRINNPWSIH